MKNFVKNLVSLSIFSRTSRVVGAWVMICLFTGNLFAVEVAGDFSAANKLYAEGKFAAAATAYESILHSGKVSANLWFNYGNAEFKAGNLGKAIAAFRRAELLAPRDQEIRANLGYVRNQVQGSTAHQAHWQDWFGQLTLNEWAWLTVAAFWLTFILLAVRQVRPVLVPKLKTATSIGVMLTMLFGAVLGVQAAAHFSNAVAVVTTADASARSGPFDDAQGVFASRDGAELSVLSGHDDWVQVTDGTGKIGWLNKKQAQVVPGI